MQNPSSAVSGNVSTSTRYLWRAIVVLMRVQWGVPNTVLLYNATSGQNLHSVPLEVYYQVNKSRSTETLYHICKSQNPEAADTARALHLCIFVWIR